MTKAMADNNDKGVGAILPTPLQDLGAAQEEVLLDAGVLLALLATPAVEPMELGEILADAVIGDVVDISDMLPGIFETTLAPEMVAVEGQRLDAVSVVGDLIDLPGGFFTSAVALVPLFDDGAKVHTDA
uniref:hypothetical protein n=1 Tax=Aminobacter niigataensis TaxID=83265 RepID=UPI0028527E15|nr:hypothetical protein [Aminobacter niigataensis]